MKDQITVLTCLLNRHSELLSYQIQERAVWDELHKIDSDASRLSQQQQRSLLEEQELHDLTTKRDLPIQLVQAAQPPREVAGHGWRRRAGCRS
jgi:hypothetical protein